MRTAHLPRGVRPIAGLVALLLAGGAMTACIPVDPPIGPPIFPPGDRPGDPLRPEVDPHPPLIEPYDMAGNDLAGTGRAIMLRVEHTPDPQDPRRVTLEEARVYVRRGDIGPIEVTTYAFDGSVIDSWRAPDPLGNAEDPRSLEARYGVPYSVDLAVVEIVDTRTGHGSSTKVDEVVRQHCLFDPTDTICRAIDLQVNVGLDHYAVRSTTVGETIDIPVHVSLTNAGSDWAQVSGSMFVFGLLDGITFTSADPTSFDVGVLDPTVRQTYDLTYQLSCEVAGDYRVFVGAGFADGAREAVDPTPDNRWNTWFDVECT